MRMQTFTRTFKFPQEDTCNTEWRFTLSESTDGLIIEDLQILSAVGTDGSPRGCLGHPKTIITLVRGLPVNSINADALADAACSRSLACGQAMARCLKELSH